jgi:RHS repeat-associated protein
MRRAFVVAVALFVSSFLILQGHAQVGVSARANQQTVRSTVRPLIAPHAPARSKSAPQDPDLTGFFAGVASQPNGPVVPTFGYEMTLLEDDTGAVTGQSYVYIYDSPYYALITLTGQVSGDVLTFQNGTILQQVPPPNAYWCILSGTLTASADGETLNGPWTAPGCAPGTISVSGIDGRLLGLGGPGSCNCGDPININSGNVYEEFTDYKTAGQNPLQFTRFYNSRALNTFAVSLATNWRSTFDRYLQLSPSTVAAERANGEQITFTLSGSAWTTDTDVDVTLTNAGSTWTLTDHDDTVETYTAITSGEGRLTSIKFRNGYIQTLAYNTSGQLASVTDSYNRSFILSYLSSGLLNTVVTPDNTTLTYGYSSSSGGTNLASVTFATSPAQTINYVYEDANLPNALTGVIDELGGRYKTWSYDSYARGLTSQVGVGSNADTTTNVYNDTTGTNSSTNALGVQDTYTLTVLQGVPKVTQINRAATLTTAAATRAFTYDTNGFLASATDWNSNKTTYKNDLHGDPTTINEAAGSGVARTTTIKYDPTYVHLPGTVTTTDLTTVYKYAQDGTGDLLTKTLTDTTTQTVPYSTNGETHVWTYTWSDFLLASSETPNSKISNYSYSASGALTAITNPLKQATNITQSTGGGYPQTLVDPNGVTTTITYDARQRIQSKAISGSGSTFTTLYTVNPASELAQVTLPDNSFLAYTYDTAHRITEVADNLGNSIQYTLDALGDKQQSNIYDSTNSLRRLHSASFDALGRMLTDVGGVQGETTIYSYDPNGNVLTIIDPLIHKTSQTFDALNRLATSLDANKGTTRFSYDTHDQPLKLTDPNGNPTSYVRDGFENAIQKTSPDAGVTVYHFDDDNNLIQKTDALAIITLNTFDALDRILTTKYPSDSTLNVTFGYDHTGTGYGFGIGHLTNVSDAAGSLTRSYDERGNLLREKRLNAGHSYSTTYTYDPASRIASIAYPDGALASNQYDTAGYFRQLSATPKGSTTNTTLATIGHLPFGPLNSVSFGNGITETWMFDLDYRPTNISDTLSTTAYQKLSYKYDVADNLRTIGDAVNPPNTQTLGYDMLNRITSAVSGAGGYGNLGWKYDNNGNLETATVGSTQTIYTTANGSNRLASYQTGSIKTVVSTNANGNITSIPPIGSKAAASFGYSAANRLSSVTGTSPAATLVYDAFGRRFSKTNSTIPILYFYSQDGSLLEENNNGVYTDYLYADDRPIADLQPNNSLPADQINYVLADRLGTPQAVINNSTVAVWSNTYQPYGQGGIPVSAIINNLRLPAQHYDLETGFHYNVSRDYMPNLGRYAEADPIGLEGALNTYAYANGNPHKFVDRTGLLPQWLQNKITPTDLRNMQANLNQATNNAFTSAEIQQLTQFLLNDMTVAQATDFVNIWSLQSIFDAQNMTQNQLNDITSLLNDLGGPLGDKARAQFQIALQNGTCKLRSHE